MKCKNCKEKFEPIRFNQKYCLNKICVAAWVQEATIKNWQNKKKKMQAELETVQDLVKAAQLVFNKYIRERDKHRPCISCDKPLVGKYDAGHFYSVGSYPNLRFNEDNCHGQCVECNQHKHGNLIEYSLRLPDRIGTSQYHHLHQIKNDPLRLSLDEIKNLIQYYRKILKSLK
jgi:hypothetical protein